MKKILLMAFSLILLSGCSAPPIEAPPTPTVTDDIEETQPDETPEEITEAPSTPDIIAEIRENFTKINNAEDNYRTIEKEILGKSAEGGNAVYYIDDEGYGLAKIVATYFGETGKSIVEYYYHEGELFFVFNQKYKYNRPIIYDEEMAAEFGDDEVFDISKSTITEDRYYFDKDELIRWLDNDKEEVASTSDEFAEKNTELIENSHSLINRLGASD